MRQLPTDNCGLRLCWAAIAPIEGLRRVRNTRRIEIKQRSGGTSARTLLENGLPIHQLRPKTTA